MLTINCGSSSLKASLFKSDGNRRNFHYAHLDDDKSASLKQAFDALLKDLGKEQPDIVAHRFVHGGDVSDAARMIDEDEHNRLQQLVQLAPLHMPANLLGVEICSKLFSVPQIACFDTAFHSSMPALAKRLPIPEALNMHRFGFHGLNYAYIAKLLPNMIGKTAHKKVIAAHLGSGASLCLMDNLQSVDTTMGYTPAGGIVMGTRSGDLDPGVMLELAQRYSVEDLKHMVFHHMGLLALSGGESADMQNLLTSSTPAAKFAIDYFCRQIRGAIGAMAAKAGGVDALVFSAGIGEHAAAVREKICTPLAFLGFAIDADLNQTHAANIASTGSKPILIIAADEEIMMRDLCAALGVQRSSSTC
ncbi:MAG: acetate kinase [Methylotenera sp.]